ncbi:hypothetical protein PTTG_30095, partial [Puccinia triticina 1-1 BBBD Race 1]
DLLNRDFQQSHNKLEGSAHEVVSIVFKGLAKKKTIFPQNFSSANGQAAVKCNMKANKGLLYFLDKFVLFISKQPILINLADLHLVKFARVRGALQSGRTFDLVLTKKEKVDLQFSSLSREEHPVIESYFDTKGKKIKNKMNEDVLSAAVGPLSNNNDAANANDDDDESDDESFHGGSDDSDVAEEFDSNYRGSDSDNLESEDEGNSAAAKVPAPSSKKNKASGTRYAALL